MNRLYSCTLISREQGETIIEAKRNPINRATIATATVIRVALNNSSPQPLFPKDKSSIRIRR